MTHFKGMMALMPYLFDFKYLDLLKITMQMAKEHIDEKCPLLFIHKMLTNEIALVNRSHTLISLK